MAKKCSILIVNFNGGAFIQNCIESIKRSECSYDIEVIIVDNQSNDNSLEVLKEYKDDCIVIQNMDNSGFSRGTNIAASFATGDVFFLLNNDTVLNKDTIEKCIESLERDDSIGALSPKLLNKDGSLQSPGSILGSWRFRSKKKIEVPFIAGAAVFMKKTVFDKIGGLDENLYFYNDDIDLCKTIKKHGYKIVYEPAAELIHIGGLSTNFRKLTTLLEGYRGGFYICYKHYSSFVLVSYRILMNIDVFIRILFHLCLAVFSVKHKKYVSVYLNVIKLNIQKDFFVTYPELNVKKL